MIEAGDASDAGEQLLSQSGPSKVDRVLVGTWHCFPTPPVKMGGRQSA